MVGKKNVLVATLGVLAYAAVAEAAGVAINYGGGTGMTTFDSIVIAPVSPWTPIQTAAAISDTLSASATSYRSGQTTYKVDYLKNLGTTVDLSGTGNNWVHNRLGGFVVGGS